MEFNHTQVMNFEGAFRGMRNPMNSWAKSDSTFNPLKLGPNDLDLAKRLIQAGPEHRKFLRQIFVCVDITSSLYHWKELDQYRINVTTNSCSTMHKLASTPITLDCFETGDLTEGLFDYKTLISDLEFLRLKYNETKDKRYWKELIRWLPESWLQTRTWTGNYENLRSIYHQRAGHKLTEWQAFRDWIASLPYAEELIF